MAKKWIKGAIQHPGALTRAAAARGETCAQLIAHQPKNASPKLKKEIALAKTLRSFHHK
jgi:hypothetical protein